MKKIFKVPSLILLFICFSVITVMVASHTANTPQDYTKGALSIHNTTAYTLENVSITFNQNQTLTLKSISSSTLMTVDFPDTDFITSVSILGTTADGKSFSNSFSGLITNDSCLIIYLDDYMNLRVSSNIPE